VVEVSSPTHLTILNPALLFALDKDVVLPSLFTSQVLPALQP